MIADLLFIAAMVSVLFLAGATFAVGCNVAWWAVERWKAARNGPATSPPAALSGERIGTDPQG